MLLSLHQRFHLLGNMKKVLLAFFLIAPIFCCVDKIDVSTYKKVIQSKGLTVIDFFALWCGPCREFVPILESACIKCVGVEFYKINISGVEEKKLMKTVGVKVIPTVIFYKNGQEVHRSVGRLPEKELLKLIAQYKV